LKSSITGLQHFDYGELLLRRKKQEGIVLRYEELREQSSAVVSSKDVSDTDEWVASEIARLRATCDVIIDSHALTREEYGFRAIPYSTRQLDAIKFDAIVVLRCDPQVLITRVSADPRGRRGLTIELARDIQVLQEALGLHYAVVSGCTAFVIDTTERTAEEVRIVAVRLLKQLGAKVSTE